MRMAIEWQKTLVKISTKMDPNLQQIHFNQFSSTLDNQEKKEFSSNVKDLDLKRLNSIFETAMKPRNEENEIKQIPYETLVGNLVLIIGSSNL